jgi:hypothetical protein
MRSAARAIATAYGKRKKTNGEGEIQLVLSRKLIFSLVLGSQASISRGKVELGN